MMATLGEILSEDQLLHLEDLVSRRKITTGWIQDVFIPRLSEELDHIDWMERGWRDIDLTDPRYAHVSAEERDTVITKIQERRAQAFGLALNPNIFQRARAEIQPAHRAIHSGEWWEIFKKDLKEAGPMGVAKDVGKSLVESIPRGVEATGKTLTEGFGETPLERIGEMSGAIPVAGGVAGGLARLLGRSALKSAGRSVIRSAGIQALKDAPEAAVKEALESGVGGGRAGLAKALSKVAEATRIPGYIGEAADIAAAGEHIGYEALLEGLGEGAVEGGRFAGRRAVDQLKGESTDPIQQKQQQRAADNDTAAAAASQRARGAKAQAALDALSVQLVNVTHQVAAGKNDPSVDDIYRITPQAFVEAFENHVGPGFAQQIDALEAEGVYDAQNVIRARILDLHQQIQQDLNQQLNPAGQGETPEQAAAADMAGQPPQETKDADTTTTDTTETGGEVDLEGSDTAHTDDTEVSPDTTEATDPDQTGTQTPQPEVEPTPEERDWSGLDAEVGNEVLETLSQDPDADMETTVDASIATLVENQVLSPEDGDALKTKVIEQVTPAVEELRRNNIPPERIGPETVGYWSDEDPDRPIHVRPIVRELEDVIPSHDTDGNLRADYPEGLQPREQRSGPVAVQKNKEDAAKFNPDSAIEFKRNFAHGPPLTSKQHLRAIIAGTGRRTILEIVRDNYPEKWEAYQQRLREELESFGMDPSFLDDMKSPILTYELVSDLDEVELAKDTNQDSMLGHSSAEEATFDAELLAGDVLYHWNDTDDTDFTKALESPENADFRSQIINRIPKRQQSEFLTSDNKNLSEAGQKRLLNAMTRYIFDGELGTEFGRRLIDRGSGGNVTLDAVLQNIIPSLAKMKAAGIDISEHLTRAVDKFLTHDNTAADEASSEENKRRETGPLTKEELLWRNIETSFRSAGLFESTPLIENQLLYLIYAKKKGNAYKDAINAFRELSRAAIELKRKEPDADAIANTEQIATRMIVDYLVSEAYVPQAQQQSLEVLIDRMPPEVRDIRIAYEQAEGIDAKKAAAEAQITEILKLLNEGQEVDPNATTETEKETLPTPDATGVSTVGGGADGERARGEQVSADRGDPSETDETSESAEGDGPDVDRDASQDAVRTTTGAETGVPTDDTGSGVGAEDAPEQNIGRLLAVLDAAFRNSGNEESVSIDDWETASDAEKREIVARARYGIENQKQMRGTGFTAREEASQQQAVDALENLITQQEATSETSETQPTRRPRDDRSSVPDGSTDQTVSRREQGTASESTEGAGETPSQETQTPVDTNQVVGTSRRIEPQETPTVSPVVQRDLDALGISVDEWEQIKAEDRIEAFINSLSFEQQEAIEFGVNLIGDQNESDIEAHDSDLDDDLFSDVDEGTLHDITDEQRANFDIFRRKAFIAKTIQRLEAKGQDRTAVETAQLRALQAPRRTESQQRVYEQMLTSYMNSMAKSLRAKSELSATEQHVLDAIEAVQAEGLPEEASERSLSTDLETPDQAHGRVLSESKTLAGVSAPDTADTELNLPETTKNDPKKLSPAQQTTVKAIIAAFKRKIHTTTDTTVQGGYLLADKMGVGKTRQALATILHYMRSGINRHFILAPSQSILANFSKDMGAIDGNPNDISVYGPENRHPKTPIGAMTYSSLVSTPNFDTLSTHNALASLIEHLIGIRPSFAQTHPRVYRDASEAYARIFQDPSVVIDTVEDAIAELRRQAERVNLKNQEHIHQFRARVPTQIADALLAARGYGETTAQGELFTETADLHRNVSNLLAFRDILNAPNPDLSAAAEAFEGVIALDEVHKAGNPQAAIGEAIATLHRFLPNAKFLYMSATPFKKVENMEVAERLGLWGENQPFQNFQNFLRAFRHAHHAVKEIIALHIKQMGRYVSRALSSKETRYTPVDIPLTDTDKHRYDTGVELVNVIRSKFFDAIETALRSNWAMTELAPEGAKIENQYKSHYSKMFHAQMQTFFLALLDAMKAEGLRENILDKLNNGDKVIVQLENTWDSVIQTAREAGHTGSIGPFELLTSFVSNDNQFPVHKYTTKIVSDGRGGTKTQITKQMEYNAEGELVPAIDPNLKRLQQQALQALELARRKTPVAGGIQFAADIIHRIAADANKTSAEISGRTEIYPGATREPVKMSQTEKSKEERADAFSRTTDLNLLVLGPAGLTGINLPILEEIKDKVGGLFHYLIQSSWNVNTFEQGLGRGKRTNSAIDPHYIIAHQDLPGSQRVLGATLAKFAEMGALVGQADNALMQNIDKAESNLDPDDDPDADVAEALETEDGEQPQERAHVFGKHGSEALYDLWLEMYNTGDMSLATQLGLPTPVMNAAVGVLESNSVPDAKTFFHRLLYLKTADQPDIYARFEGHLKRIIQLHKELGTLDTGANDLGASDGRITDRLTVYTDPDTGQSAEVVRLDTKRKLPRRSWTFAEKVLNGEPGYDHFGEPEGLFVDPDGHIWMVFPHPSGEDVYYRWGPRGTPVQGLHKGDSTIEADDLALYRQVNPLEAKQLWEAEDASADTHVASEMFMATGLVLPKWNDLQIHGADRQILPPVMGVIPMIDGSQLHGLMIPASRVSEVLEQIGGVNPNHFDADRQQSPPNGGGVAEVSDVDIPAIVRDIIGQQTDTKISARLNNIVEHIHKKLPLRLRGHLVRSAAEAALLGQLIRDPQVEHTWIVYRKDDRIVKIEPMSLNRKGETEAGDFAHIKRETARLGADSILRIHNHPSGVARWSGADKRAAMQWHRELGTLMAEDIIVDSGTYAYRTFENGEYTWHEDTVLDPNAVDFDTGAETVSDASGEQKPTDPLYQNPLIRGAREAATYMMGIKRRTTDIAELIFVDTKTGKIANTFTDTSLRKVTDPVQYVKSALMSAKGQQVHIAMWGDDAAVSIARSLQRIDGVDSVWVNAQRVTGLEHIGEQKEETTTKDIGGTQQTFVKVVDTLSDPNKPESPLLKKSFIVAGVQQDLTEDANREDPFKRTIGDAEHIVSAKRQLDVSRLDPTALENARQAIEEGIQQTLVPDESLDNRIEKLEAHIAQLETYKDLLTSLALGTGDFSRETNTVGEQLDFIEATPDLQIDPVKAIFEGIDPETKTWDTDINKKLLQLKNRIVDAIYDSQIKVGDLEEIQTVEGFFGEIKTLQTDLNEKTAYRKALDDLGWKKMGTQTIQEMLDFIEATPALQTNEVRDLFTGIDPTAETWRNHDNLLEKIHALKNQVWDETTAIKNRLRDIRNRADSRQGRALIDLVEEINQSYRMSVNRIEEGLEYLPESAQPAITAALDQLWGHIATEKGVLDTVLKSGVIKALSPTGDPDVNEGMLAYTSWSSYYRRSEGFHDNGVILDMELILDTIPNVTGTVHVRNDWGERMDLESSAEIREAMDTWRDTDEDIVIEIRIPQDIDINQYLVGIIEDKTVYVKPDQLAKPDEQIDQSFLRKERLSDYQPSAETPHINRATRAMPTKDQLSLQGKGKTRKWLSPQSQLFEKLRLWTPKLREHKRVLSNAVRSGYGMLEELKSPWDSDKPGPGDIIEDMLDQRMHLSQTWTGRTRSILTPVLKKLQQQVKRTDPKNAKALRAAVDHDIINFIEHNTPLRPEFRAFESIATDIKKAWRKVNQSYLEAMIQLIRDVSHREEITKVGGKGRVKWAPEPMGDFQWDWRKANGEGRFVDKQGKEYTIAEAFAETDSLWYPHQYDRSRLRHYNRKMEDLVKALNELAAKGDAASGDALATAGVEKVAGGYLHRQLKTTFPDLDAVIAYYTEIRDRTATLIKMYEDGTIGMYPHLERVRETQDRLYRRDTSLLLSTSALLWDRFAEIATFGQIDDLGHLPPRLATLLQTVEHFTANDREAALMAVIDGLQATKESRIAAGEDAQDWGMHESIPAFEGGEAAALRIMQQWEDYYIDDDGNKVKTGKWKGIDINRLNLDGKTLHTLQQIGFIQRQVDAEVSDTSASTSPDGQGGWQVHGKSDAAQQTTIARFFVELMQTQANRKRKIQELVQALGHWQQKDPLTETGGELWRRMNTLVSIGALGWKQALQNLTEIPAVVMMAGTKSSVGMVKDMQDPDFRAAANELVEGAKQGVEFLSDDNLQETYLNSKWSGFGYLERVSRMIGIGVGLTHARNLSRELLASTEGSKERGRIEREMRRLRMNPDAILQMQPGQLNAIFDEVIQRIKDREIALAGLELPSAPPPQNELTDRIGEEFVRSAMYISDTVFKPYDARTLPDAFNSKDPRFRVFLKFKGWMLQQNRFMVDQYKRAYQEARQHGNFRPLRNVLASTLMLTGSVGMTQWVYALLQGRDDDDELLRAFLHTQTLGLGAVLWEMALRSEGSPWRLEKTFEGTVVGPVWGTFADVIAPTATFDLDRALQEVMQRTPGAREMLQIGADKWWDDLKKK